MKKNDLKKPLLGILTLLLCTIASVATAQDMYVSNGAILHYAGGDFASGVIDNTIGGAFSVGADYVHSESNYVKGPVSFLAAKAFNVSLELKATNRVPNFTSTGAASISYNATTAPTGTAPAGHTLANAEVYTFTGNVSAGTAIPLATTTFGSAVGSVVVVYADANGDTWSTTATPGTTKVMTFAKQDVVLATEEYLASSFAVYPNPVQVGSSSVNYSVPNTVKQLDVAMYNLLGKQVAYVKNAAVATGVNTFAKPQVASGIYFLQFAINNGESVITKKLIIK